MRLRTAIAAAVLACSAAASAQPVGFDVERKDKAKLEPPVLNAKADDPGQTWIMIGAVVMILLAVTVNLIPSKRGHQD